MLTRLFVGSKPPAVIRIAREVLAIPAIFTRNRAAVHVERNKITDTGIIDLTEVDRAALITPIGTRIEFFSPSHTVHVCILDDDVDVSPRVIAVSQYIARFIDTCVCYFSVKFEPRIGTYLYRTIIPNFIIALYGNFLDPIPPTC